MIFTTNKRSTNTKADYRLRQERWDDFGQLATYRLLKILPKGDLPIGNVKIISKTKVELPSVFDALDSNFCSMGQSVRYYDKLLSESKEVLIALRDIRINVENVVGFNELDVRRVLLRNVTAERLREAPLRRTPVPPSSFSLNVETQLNGFSSPHKLKIAFDSEAPIPKRVAVLIGPSGTGKTGLLGKISHALVNTTHGSTVFVSQPPLFHRVVAMAYGVMQPFDEFTQDPDTYVYCGSRNMESFGSVAAAEHFGDLLTRLAPAHRPQWWLFWKELLRDTAVGPLLSSIQTESVSVFGQLSAGHRMFAIVYLDLLSNLSNHSLLLFDEPETHLHPALLNRLLGLLYDLLEERNSYAIVATHAPLVVQSVLAKQVYILNGVGGASTISHPDRETFASGLSELTEVSFGYENISNTYEKIIERAIAKTNKLLGQKWSVG